MVIMHDLLIRVYLGDMQESTSLQRCKNDILIGGLFGGKHEMGECPGRVSKI